MRVNVYAEEIAGFEHGWKEIEGRRMFWLRVKMLSHPSMVQPEHRDDDSPAVTFWFDNMAEGYRFVNALRNAIDRVAPGDP